jgi:DNA-binding LytR/AlgR family response regulator
MKYPLKTLLVEDEETDAFVLKKYLNDFNRVISIDKVVTTYEEAVCELLNTSYNLTLIDINLNDNYQGYNLINEVGKNQLGIIVFFTQRSEAPLEFTSYEFLYLNKPLSEKKIKEFIKKLQDKISRNFTELGNAQKPFLFRDESFDRPISADKIVYIKIYDESAEIHYDNNTQKAKCIIKQSLSNLTNILSSDMFCQIHKNCLVNIFYVEKLGDHIIYLKPPYFEIELSASERMFPFIKSMYISTKR